MCDTVPKSAGTKKQHQAEQAPQQSQGMTIGPDVLQHWRVDAQSGRVDLVAIGRDLLRQ